MRAAAALRGFTTVVVSSCGTLASSAAHIIYLCCSHHLSDSIPQWFHTLPRGRAPQSAHPLARGTAPRASAPTAGRLQACHARGPRCPRRGSAPRCRRRRRQAGSSAAAARRRARPRAAAGERRERAQREQQSSLLPINAVGSCYVMASCSQCASIARACLPQAAEAPLTAASTTGQGKSTSPSALTRGPSPSPPSPPGSVVFASARSAGSGSWPCERWLHVACKRWVRRRQLGAWGPQAAGWHMQRSSGHAQFCPANQPIH